MTQKISAREIDITSDDGRYNIKGKLVSLQDCYSVSECGYRNYKGSTWTVAIYHNGQVVNGIQVREPYYQPYIHFGEYFCGLCQHGVKLSKNTILYGAVATHMFGKALANVDAKKIEKQYYKEYVEARIKREQEQR